MIRRAGFWGFWGFRGCKWMRQEVEINKCRNERLDYDQPQRNCFRGLYIISFMGTKLLNAEMAKTMNTKARTIF